MTQINHIKNIFLLAVILPLFLGQLINIFFSITIISVPLHSVLEASGGTIAIAIFLLIFIRNMNTYQMNHYYYASTALAVMGIVDIFHASVPTGEIFVWLHSLAVFLGGILFVFVWKEPKNSTRINYFLIPILLIAFSVMISIASILFPHFIPQMLNLDGSFSTVANLLNIIGGVCFFIASIKFSKNHIKLKEIDDLPFIGLTMLFGIAGILFVSSVIWDMQWWLWHILRLLAYMVAALYIIKLYILDIQQIENMNARLNDLSNKLVNSNKNLETEVYEKTKKLNDFVRSTTDFIWEIDKNGIYTYIDGKIKNILGYTADEIIGKRAFDFMPESEAKKISEIFTTTIQEKSEIKNLINLHISKDGKKVYLLKNAVPVFNSDGDFLGYRGLDKDITELMLLREQMKESTHE